MPAADGLSFDDALTKYVGEFGKGQVCGILLAAANMHTADSAQRCDSMAL